MARRGIGRMRAGGGLVEKLANTGFDSDTVWTKGANWTISGGVATKTSGAQNSITQIPLVPFNGGRIYTVAFTVLNYTGGGFTPVFSGGVTVTGTTRTANGTY